MINSKKQKFIPDSWIFESIGDLLDYEQPTDYIVESTNYSNDYKIPVLTAGKTFILGYTDEQVGVHNNTPVIIFDDFTTAIKYVDFPFKVKSSAMKILKNKPKKVNLKFIYGWMQIHPFAVGEHKRNYLSEYQHQDVLLPTMDEQNNIVQILEVWDDYLKKITKKIEIKKNIKKGLMQRFIYNSKNTKDYKVSDLFDLGRGRVISKNEINKNIGDYPVYSSQTSNDGVLGKINTYDFEGEYFTWTTDGAHAGRVYYRQGKFNCTNVCGTAKLKKDKKINIYFVASFLNNITKRYVSYVGNPKLMNGVFGSILVKIPPINVQNSITKILIQKDLEIKFLLRKIKLIEDQKRYLLNNLITGKIRIPEFQK